MTSSDNNRPGEDPSREVERLRAAIRQTEYKYFGDYEMSDDQWAAVDALVECAEARIAALTQQEKTDD